MGSARLIRGVMRPAGEADGNVPRWSLWLVALVCFGPLALVLLLGVIALPLWFGMIAVQLAEPERFPHESSEVLVGTVWPILLVVSGIIGLIGLLRVLTLPRRGRPTSSRVLTVGMIAVGLIALAVFDLGIVAGVLSDFSAGIPIAGIVVYIALPFAGAAWLLSKSWKYLFAGPSPRGSHNNRMERTRDR